MRRFQHSLISFWSTEEVVQETSKPKRTRARRIEAAWRRARIAKTTVAGVAVVAFGVWMALARVTYAGHPKHHIRPLAIPQPMYDVVRRNLLQAGILAPATAPPDATTSSS